MLKLRLMGTKDSISEFEEFLSIQPEICVLDMSDMYRNKGTSRYFRAYLEIEKNEVIKKEINHV